MSIWRGGQSFSSGMLVLGAFGMVTMLGCSSAEFSEDGTQASAATDGKADNDGVQEPAPIPALSTYYVLHLDAALSVTEEGSNDDPVDYTASLSGIVHNLGEGPELLLDLYPCQVELPEIDGRKIELPNATVQKLDPVSIFGKLERNGETIQLRTNATALVAGASLADALLDALPEDGDDARVVDVDLDRRPGITLKISGVKVYTAMRMTFNLNGEFLSESELEGNAELSLDFQVFGDSSPFVNAQAAAEKAVDKLEVLSQTHHFTMSALPDGESPSCEALGFLPGQDN